MSKKGGSGTKSDVFTHAEVAERQRNSDHDGGVDQPSLAACFHSPYFSLLSLFVVFLSHFPLPKNENTNDFLTDLKHLTFRSIRSITGTTHDPTMHDPWQKVSQTENVQALSALRQSESLFLILGMLGTLLEQHTLRCMW